MSSRPAINFIESSLRESKTFENYLEDNVATYEEHCEESKEGEKTSLIKTINSIDSGCVEQASSPVLKTDKDILESLFNDYVDQGDLQICSIVAT